MRVLIVTTMFVALAGVAGHAQARPGAGLPSLDAGAEPPTLVQQQIRCLHNQLRVHHKNTSVVTCGSYFAVEPRGARPNVGPRRVRPRQTLQAQPKRRRRAR